MKITDFFKKLFAILIFFGIIKGLIRFPNDRRLLSTMKKRIASIFLSMLFMCCFCVNVLTAGAISFTPSFDINSSAGLLINLDTDEVVYQKNADTQYMPGSLVQIMEAVIVLENCQNLGTRITADASLYGKYADSEYPDDIRFADIKDHDTLTVEELLYAMMLTSSVEASVMLANQFGNGSMSAFVDMMNARAQELGCTQTHFTNVTGMYDISQKTTANDMALITRHALSLNKFEQIATTVSFAPFSANQERHDEDWIWTHSNLMVIPNSEYHMEGAKGIKTANLTAQGRNIITEASRDGNHFLVILLAAPFEDKDGHLKYYHIEDATTLFEWVFTHFSFRTILTDSAELGQISVKNGSNTDYVLVKPAKSYGMLWYDAADVNSITQDIELRSNVSAPVNQGDVLGSVTLKFSGEEITTVDLVATSSVELSNMKYYLALAKHFPKTEWLGRAILFSILLSAIYIALCAYSHMQYLKRRKPVTPVHLKPNSAAVKREARKAEHRNRDV